MKTVHLFLLLFALFTTSFTTPSYHSNEPPSKAFAQETENDGSSFEKAIVILETSSGAGIAAEYKWLRDHYPGYKMKKQMLSHHNGKPYDILQFKYKRRKRTVFFDISAFFGKF